jgi:hypothetical protein
MTDEFALYPEALALKQMGYDKPMSFGRWYGYTTDLPIELQIGLTKDTNAKFIAAKADRLCIAPTYAQAFRWFRDNHNLHGQVNIRTWFIYEVSNGNLTLVALYDKLNNSHEESELACLKGLIQIVKQKL